MSVAKSRPLVYVVVLALLNPVFGAEPTGQQLYQEGQAFEKQGRWADAYLKYSEAAAASPKDKSLWRKAESLRTRAIMQAKVVPTEAPSDAPAAPESGKWTDDADASFDSSPPTAQDIEEGRKPQPPQVLSALPDTRSFDLRGDSNSLYEQVAKSFGLDVIFDSDYTPLRNLRFQMDGVGYKDALYSLGLATESFVVPITPKLLLVVQDTQMKRSEQEVNVAVDIPIPDAVTIQQAQELAQSVRQVMEIQKFGIDSANRIVFMRDRISKVRPAEELFIQLMGLQPQVYIEVQILSFDTSKSYTYGLTPPTSTVLTDFAKIANLKSFIPTNFVNFLTFGGGYSFFGLGITGATLFAQMTSSLSTSVYRAEALTRDGEAVSFTAGQKYPIITAQYQGVTGSSGLAPTFNFEDLGLTMKVTPKVHGIDEVSMDIEAEFKSLSGGSINGIPIIARKSFKTGARMKFGEEAILAGLVDHQYAHDITGLPVLASATFIGPLFGKHDRSQRNSETLVLVKPTLVSMPPSQKVTHPIWIGTDSRMRIPL